MEMAGWFVYHEDEDQYFKVTSDDDAWLFIDGELAIDLGGLHTPRTGSVEVNQWNLGRLGVPLEEGRAYEFKLFYAERQRTGAAFGFETNIPIDTPHVGVEAIDDEALETAPDRAPNVGVFRFWRTGDIGAQLTIHYQVGGTAGAEDYSARDHHACV